MLLSRVINKDEILRSLESVHKAFAYINLQKHNSRKR